MNSFEDSKLGLRSNCISLLYYQHPIGSTSDIYDFQKKSHVQNKKSQRMQIKTSKHSSEAWKVIR